MKEAYKAKETYIEITFRPEVTIDSDLLQNYCAIRFANKTSLVPKHAVSYQRGKTLMLSWVYESDCITDEFAFFKSADPEKNDFPIWIELILSIKELGLFSKQENLLYPP